ncbi:MAG: hypothetical protein ACKVJU_02810 [Verrucomicrobiales bacterium]
MLFLSPVQKPLHGEELPAQKVLETGPEAAVFAITEPETVRWAAATTQIQ